jgi:hypothetical protein
VVSKKTSFQTLLLIEPVNRFKMRFKVVHRSESMIRPGISAGIVFFISALNLASQDRVPPSNPQDAFTATKVPDSRKDWTLEVRTSGGLTGQGVGGFAVTSLGELTCDPSAPCTLRIQDPELQLLVGLVNSVDFLPWTRAGGDPSFHVLMPPSICSDCIVTTMVLHLRDSKSVEWKYTVSWDTTSQSNVPVDFMRIFRAVRELASKRV